MARAFTLDFLKTETAAGAALVLAAADGGDGGQLALSESYFAFLKQPITLQAGAWAETHSVYEWVKEGLMAVFFFIEASRSSTRCCAASCSEPQEAGAAGAGGGRRHGAPGACLCGGSTRPAAGRRGGPSRPPPTSPSPWPALAVFGRGLPASLRVFLLTLAIVDDLGRGGPHRAALHRRPELGRAGGRGRRARLHGAGQPLPARLAPCSTRSASWWSGPSSWSPASAPRWPGVAAAFTIPLAAPRPGEDGVLEEYMESLHPYVAYGVLPLFAFTSAGFSFPSLSLDVLLEPVTLGSSLGLFVGKQIGVFGFAWLAVRLGGPGARAAPPGWRSMRCRCSAASASR
jgi:NhaA family Na+:H+ antiporter